MASVAKRRRQDAPSDDSFETTLALVTHMYPGEVPLGTNGAHRYPSRVEGPDGVLTNVRKGDARYKALHPGELAALHVHKVLRPMLALKPGDVLCDPCAARAAALFFLVLATGCDGVASELVPDRYEEAVQALQIAVSAPVHEDLSNLPNRITLHLGNMLHLSGQGCYDNVTHLWLADEAIDKSDVRQFEKDMVDRMRQLRIVVKNRPIGCKREQPRDPPAKKLCSQANPRNDNCRCVFYHFVEERAANASWAATVRVLKYSVTHPNDKKGLDESFADAFRADVESNVVTSVPSEGGVAIGNGIELLLECTPESAGCGEEASPPCPCRNKRRVVQLEQAGMSFLFEGWKMLHRSLFAKLTEVIFKKRKKHVDKHVVLSFQFFLDKKDTDPVSAKPKRSPKWPVTNGPLQVEIPFDAQHSRHVSMYFLKEWFGDLATFTPLSRTFNGRPIDVDRTRELSRDQLVMVAGSFPPLATLLAEVEKTCSSQGLGDVILYRVWVILKSNQPESQAVTAFPDFHVDYKAHKMLTLILVGAVYDAESLANYLKAARQAQARVAEAVACTHTHKHLAHTHAYNGKRA